MEPPRDDVDDLTHYMQATGRMRERAETAEARVAELEDIVGRLLDFGVNDALRTRAERALAKDPLPLRRPI